MVHIYVLQLQQGKYYVGKTSNPAYRLECHAQGEGSEWTRLYKPVKLVELIPDCDDYDEDKYTIMYMDQHGIENVRGGAYSSVQLDKDTKAHLALRMHAANNQCFRCGKHGHFALECRADIVKQCYRCGRKGHYAPQCYARRNVDGQAIPRGENGSGSSDSESEEDHSDSQEFYDD
jgi:hypothetical protein